MQKATEGRGKSRCLVIPHSALLHHQLSPPLFQSFLVTVRFSDAAATVAALTFVLLGSTAGDHGGRAV